MGKNKLLKNFRKSVLNYVTSRADAEREERALRMAADAARARGMPLNGALNQNNRAPGVRPNGTNYRPSAGNGSSRSFNRFTGTMDNPFPVETEGRQLSTGGMGVPSRTTMAQIGGSALAGAALTTGLAAASGGFSRKKKKPALYPAVIGPDGRPLTPAYSGPAPYYSGPNNLPKGPRLSAASSNSGQGTFAAPVAYGSTRRGNNPKMWAKARQGDVSVRVRHCEYIRDIKGTGADWTISGSPQNVYKFPVNPGRPQLFGWLSELAGMFDEYEFNDLKFHFEPAVGTDTDGKLIMTFDPDVVDEVPDTKQQALQARVQVDSVPWASSVLKVPRDMLQGRRYVRIGGYPAGVDPHIYDIGGILFALPNVPAGMAGEWFVDYDVTFYSPSGGEDRYGCGTWNTATSAITVANPLGNGVPATSLGPYVPLAINGSGFTMVSPGVFLVTASYAGTGFTSGGTVTATAPNTVGLLNFGFSATSALVQYVINVVDPTINFGIASPGGATSVTSTTLRVGEYDLDAQ